MEEDDIDDPSLLEQVKDYELQPVKLLSQDHTCHMQFPHFPSCCCC